jgi:hypothetical protein
MRMTLKLSFKKIFLAIIFGLLSKSNRLIYPKQKIEYDLSAAFKRIQSVEVGVQDFHTLVVTIVEREPSYVWCSGSPASTSEKDCYFLDSDAYIFSEAPVFSGNAFFAFYGLVSDPNPVGKHYMSPEEFLKFDRLVTFADSHNLKTARTRCNCDDVVELYLDRGGKLLFKRDQDIGMLQSNILTILEGSTILSNKATTTLQYVDFRFGNKIYYK